MSLSRRPTNRRSFLAGGAAVAAAAVSLDAPRLEALSTRLAGRIDPEAWLQRLNGRHRQLFDSPRVNDGIMLVHMLNYYDTYRQAYGAPDADVNGVGTFYGETTVLGLGDTVWRKYRLGEVIALNDPATGKPAVRNIWRQDPVLEGLSLPRAGIEALQARGATFIICNNAMTFFAEMVAKAQGVEAEAVYEDFKAAILPGVVLVPAMVIAIEKAQQAGLSYHRQ